jgi:hypothetical protein
MVHAIKMGWIQPRRPQDPTPNFYDLWAQEDPNAVLGRHKMHVPAPKLALPGHEESYNPPPEYLPSEEEVGPVPGQVWVPAVFPVPLLTCLPISPALGMGAAGAGREEAQFPAAEVPKPTGCACIQPLHPRAL